MVSGYLQMEPVGDMEFSMAFHFYDHSSFQLQDDENLSCSANFPDEISNSVSGNYSLDNTAYYFNDVNHIAFHNNSFASIDDGWKGIAGGNEKTDGNPYGIVCSDVGTEGTMRLKSRYDDSSGNAEKKLRISRDGASEQSSCSQSLEGQNVASEAERRRISNSNAKSRTVKGVATYPQSLYAKKRRERINEKLKTLQNLVPNGTKVDISTMLEEAVNYVKFLQLQIKLLSSDELWMYAPLGYNGIDLGLHLQIFSQLLR